MKLKYMMATKAIHKTGDISRETPDICIVSNEDKDNYIGNWIYGFGFIDVKFPKATTRKLTTAEVKHYHGRPTVMGGGFWNTINITGEDFRKNVILTNKGTGKVRKGTLVAPIKVNNSIAMIKDSGECFGTSMVRSITGNKGSNGNKRLFVTTRNSVYTVEYL